MGTVCSPHWWVTSPYLSLLRVMASPQVGAADDAYRGHKTRRIGRLRMPQTEGTRQSSGHTWALSDGQILDAVGACQQDTLYESMTNTRWIDPANSNAHAHFGKISRSTQFRQMEG
jgi:hypothetical protein